MCVHPADTPLCSLCWTQWKVPVNHSGYKKPLVVRRRHPAATPKALGPAAACQHCSDCYCLAEPTRSSCCSQFEPLSELVLSSGLTSVHRIKNKLGHCPTLVSVVNLVMTEVPVCNRKVHKHTVPSSQSTNSESFCYCNFTKDRTSPGICGAKVVAVQRNIFDKKQV